MDTRYAGREARERQLLLAAVRQLSRSRPADHTLPALALGALGLALALAVIGAALAFGPAAPLSAWSVTPFAIALLVGAGAAWLLGAAGLVRAGLAMAQATGTKGLAALALVGNAALSVAPFVALLVL